MPALGQFRIDVEWLKKLYEGKEKTIVEMGDILGCRRGAINWHLRRLGLPSSALPKMPGNKWVVRPETEAAIRTKFSNGETPSEINSSLNLGMRSGNLEPLRRVMRELGMDTSKRRILPKGKKFGALTILDNIVTDGGSAVLVECDCGNKKTILTDAVRSGRTRSCSCRIFARTVEMSWDRVFGQIRNSCNRGRKIVFSLSREQIKFACSQNCYYCFRPPANSVNKEKKQHRIPTAWLKYSGLDRVDTALGYEPGNVLPCCYQCNVLKWSFSLEEVHEHLVRLTNGTVLWTPQSARAAAEDLGKELEALKIT